MRPRGIIATVLATVVGAATLAAATDGLLALTSEGARRLAVRTAPRALPAVVLEDQDGRRFRFDDYAGRIVLVEFVYTRCPTICSTLGEVFARLGAAFAGERARGEVGFLSISFDPEYDVPAALAAYAEQHGADGRSWRIARPGDPAALQALLETFEVVVIPDEFGGYQHNGAVLLVDRHGRLARIYDFTPVEALIDEVRPWLQS